MAIHSVEINHTAAQAARPVVQQAGDGRSLVQRIARARAAPTLLALVLGLGVWQLLTPFVPSYMLPDPSLRIVELSYYRNRFVESEDPQRVGSGLLAAHPADLVRAERHAQVAPRLEIARRAHPCAQFNSQRMLDCDARLRVVYW